MVYILENTDSLTEDFLEKANSLLTLQRLQKNDTLRITSDKINSTAVYLLLRYGLKMEYDISEPPVFETGFNGKPYPDAYLAALRKEFSDNPVPGKRIDFICQEANREINTIGSKNQFTEVGAMVINAKDALENIREQSKNVE